MTLFDDIRLHLVGYHGNFLLLLERGSVITLAEKKLSFAKILQDS